MKLPELLCHRTEVIKLIRQFFLERDHSEVDTPALAPFLIPESTIEVFATTYYPDDGVPRDLYLIPSPELWMKRLLAEGSGSIFQICKSFRNCEPIGPLHQPEFTMLEWYTVGADYFDSMKTTEALFSFLLDRLYGACSFQFAGRTIDCTVPFQRLSLDKAFQRYLNLDLRENASTDLLRAEAKNRGAHVHDDDTWEDLFFKLFLEFIEPRLPSDRPIVLYDYPVQLSTLARTRTGSPWAERWELYLAGVELANCYTEETDPQALRHYYRQQARRCAAQQSTEQQSPAGPRRFAARRFVAPSLTGSARTSSAHTPPPLIAACRRSATFPTVRE